MLQVARLAPKQLGESRDLVTAFLRERLNPDGGFQDRAGAPFMLGIGIGVEEGEGDAFHVLRAQLGHECTHGGFVERQPHGALRVDALRDRETQGARRQRFRLVDRKVEVLLDGESVLGLEPDDHIVAILHLGTRLK